MSSCVCEKIPHTPCKSPEGSTGRVTQNPSHTSPDVSWLIELGAASGKGNSHNSAENERACTTGTTGRATALISSRGQT